jgi:hypothetical protein
LGQEEVLEGLVAQGAKWRQRSEAEAGLEGVGYPNIQREGARSSDFSAILHGPPISSTSFPVVQFVPLLQSCSARAQPELAMEIRKVRLHHELGVWAVTREERRGEVRAVCVMIHDHIRAGRVVIKDYSIPSTLEELQCSGLGRYLS